MVPSGSMAEKRFHIYNLGLVDLSISMKTQSADLSFGKISEPFSVTQGPETNSIRPGTRRTTWQWYSDMKLLIGPKQCQEVITRFEAKKATLVTGTVECVSDATTVTLPFKGRGGTFGLSHKGDLNFGDCAAYHRYTRKLVLSNSGTIPSQLTMEWLVVGNRVQEGQSTNPVTLSESYSAHDPRNGWARSQLLKDLQPRHHHGPAPNSEIAGAASSAATILSALNYWELVRKLVYKPTTRPRSRPRSSSQSLAAGMFFIRQNHKVC